jgi:hypothetical protein
MLAKAAMGLSSLTRNGPCRWKASAIREVVARHGAAVEMILAILAQEGPREGAALIKNWSEGGDTGVRGWRHRPRWGEHPHARQAKQAERCSPPKRRSRAS